MTEAKPRHPMQAIHLDDRGMPRFRANRIISDLVEQGVIDLNRIAAAGYDAEDRMQLAQLVGYSVNGYGELSYVSDESFEAAAFEAGKLLTEKGPAT